MPAGEEYSWCRKAVIVNGHRIFAEEKPAPPMSLSLLCILSPSSGYNIEVESLPVIRSYTFTRIVYCCDCYEYSEGA